jgi:hypothetical protein
MDGTQLLQLLAGALAAAIFFALLPLLLPRKQCPGCGAPLPKLAAWSNRAGRITYGLTCRKCGCGLYLFGGKMPD